MLPTQARIRGRAAAEARSHEPRARRFRRTASTTKGRARGQERCGRGRLPHPVGPTFVNVRPSWSPRKRAGRFAQEALCDARLKASAHRPVACRLALEIYPRELCFMPGSLASLGRSSGEFMHVAVPGRSRRGQDGIPPSSKRTELANTSGLSTSSKQAKLVVPFGNCRSGQLAK